MTRSRASSSGTGSRAIGERHQLEVPGPAGSHQRTPSSPSNRENLTPLSRATSAPATANAIGVDFVSLTFPIINCEPDTGMWQQDSVRYVDGGAVAEGRKASLRPEAGG